MDKEVDASESDPRIFLSRGNDTEEFCMVVSAGSNIPLEATESCENGLFNSEAPFTMVELRGKSVPSDPTGALLACCLELTFLGAIPLWSTEVAKDDSTESGK